MDMKKLIALIALGTAAPLAAQGGTVSAENPEALRDVLENAGYEPELTTDSIGDPLIKFDLNGWNTDMQFYDCDEQTNTNCQSIRLSVGFNRAKPWNAADAIKMTESYRYASISLDDEGDPFVAWDIITGDGIPIKVMMRAIREYGRNVDQISNIVFAEERAEEN